jgi:hypothetical protein
MWVLCPGRLSLLHHGGPMVVAGCGCGSDIAGIRRASTGGLCIWYALMLYNHISSQ